mmetsp:Transcript_11449/g.12367  ORF Transcript_11449/g.12367 Transcript_11449/m.12367 type:complete len:459 (-) Transcript_11449:2173-3549(-)
MIDILALTMSSTLPFTGEALTTTLFLGDLSVYCQEKEVFALFRTYGPIESIQIKRSDDSAIRKPHLSYGFVKFQHRESAERALVELSGKLLLGRALRLGWASNNVADRNYQQFHIKKDPTAQIHVTFLCPLDMYPITEEKLRNIFERFGGIIDVTINRVECNQESFVHSGYGFIHYPLSEAGVNAALTAIQTMNDRVVDSIVFKCTISHGLETFLKTKNVTAAGIPRPARKSASSFDSFGSNTSSRNATARTSPASTSPVPFSYLSNGPGFPPGPSTSATAVPPPAPVHGYSNSRPNSGEFMRSNGPSSTYFRESKMDSYFSFNDERSHPLLSTLPSTSPTNSISPLQTSSIPVPSSYSNSPLGVQSNLSHYGYNNQNQPSQPLMSERRSFTGSSFPTALSPIIPPGLSSSYNQHSRRSSGGSVGSGSSGNSPVYQLNQSSHSFFSRVDSDDRSDRTL